MGLPDVSDRGLRHAAGEHRPRLAAPLKRYRLVTVIDRDTVGQNLAKPLRRHAGLAIGNGVECRHHLGDTRAGRGGCTTRTQWLAGLIPVQHFLIPIDMLVNQAFRTEKIVLGQLLVLLLLMK